MGPHSKTAGGERTPDHEAQGMSSTDAARLVHHHLLGFIHLAVAPLD